MPEITAHKLLSAKSFDASVSLRFAEGNPFYFTAHCRELDTDLEFRTMSRDRLVDELDGLELKVGVYIFQSTDRVLYVGQSKTLANRLGKHERMFERAFLLTGEQRLRQYLDYIECYLERLVRQLGYRTDQRNFSDQSEAVFRVQLEMLGGQHVNRCERFAELFACMSIALGLQPPYPATTENAQLAEQEPRAGRELPVEQTASATSAAPQQENGGLSVRVGTSLVREAKASTTLACALEMIGFEEVSRLQMKVRGLPLVSRALPSSETQYRHVQRGGWYVCTHSSTEEKLQLLQRIAKKLGRDDIKPSLWGPSLDSES